MAVFIAQSQQKWTSARLDACVFWLSRLILVVVPDMIIVVQDDLRGA